MSFKCGKCGKEFHGSDALESHKKAKHPTEIVEKPGKNNRMIFIIIIGVVFLLGVGSIMLVDRLPGKYDDFANCLSESGAIEYGAFWCPNCQAQKKLFGRSFKNVNYIECSLPDGNGQTQECIDAGIEGYPTWVFGNGERFSGVQSLERLSSLSGCPLE